MYNSVHFTINLTQERVFIDRFYRINHTKTYNLHAPTLVTSASHKITAKMRYSFTKITPFDEETTFRHTFLSSDLQCLPPAIPESFAQNIGLRLLANHPFRWKTVNIYK